MFLIASTSVTSNFNTFNYRPRFVVEFRKSRLVGKICTKWYEISPVSACNSSLTLLLLFGL